MKKDVEKVHTRIERTITRVIGTKVEIAPSDPSHQWWRVPKDGAAVFHLRPDGAVSYGTLRGTPSVRVLIHPLATATDGTRNLVFSYSERWFCARQDHFELHDLSITAFVASRRGDVEQLIRADWDSRTPCATVPFSQPHWHALATDALLAAAHGITVVAPAVADGTATAEIEGLHLPMAGWDTKREPSRMWRREMNLDSLQEWVEAVLQHLREELGSRALRFRLPT